MGIVGLTYSLAQGLARYGVTANAIAPGAATRLTATIPTDRQISADHQSDPRMSPDNIAPVALYLASEQSGWLSGRVVASMGYEVGLYENPQVIRQIESTGPWGYEDLADSIERSFRSVADGLPASVFASQLSK
jgi:hypothetical protein